MPFSACHSVSVSSGGPLAGRSSFVMRARRSSVSGWLARIVKPTAFLAGDAEHQLGRGLRRAAELVHDVDREGVGIGLGLARIGGFDQLREAKITARRAGDVAEQQADQERGAAVVDQAAHVVVMLEMAELVGEDAGDLVGTFGLVEQGVEHEDLAARQRERIRHRARQHAGRHGIVVEAGSVAQAVDELGKGGLAGRIVAGARGRRWSSPGPRTHRRSAARSASAPAARGDRRQAARRTARRRRWRLRPQATSRRFLQHRGPWSGARRAADIVRRDRLRKPRRGSRAAPAAAPTSRSGAGCRPDCRHDGFRHRPSA